LRTEVSSDYQQALFDSSSIVVFVIATILVIMAIC